MNQIDPLGLAGIVVGVSTRGFISTLGASGGTGIVIDPANSNVCLQVQACSDAGVGLAFTAAVNAGLNSGPIRSGTTNSSGIFGTGGVGLAGMGSVRVSNNGGSGSVTSGAIGGLGFGFGYAGGVQGCTTTLVCMNDPPAACDSHKPTTNLGDMLIP